MKIDKNITINLTEDDVKEIIVEKCQREGYVNVRAEDVILKVGEEVRGYGPGEYTTCVFKGCTIQCKDGVIL